MKQINMNELLVYVFHPFLLVSDAQKYLTCGKLDCKYYGSNFISIFSAVCSY